MGLKFADSRLIHEQSAFLELAKKTKLVIFDEAHLALAPTYKHTIEVLFTTSPETRILGLTATPGRSIEDFEQNDKLSELFYNNKHSINMEGYKNPLDYLQEQGFLAEPTFKLINYSPEDTEFYKRNLQELENSPDIPQSILDQLGEESKRNLLIYNAVKQEIEKGSYIILFACSVEHAKALNAFFTYLGIKSGVVVSGMRKDERNRIIQLYQKKEISVITNFGVLTTGFDAPHTNTAFITRPTRSLVLYSQMIGRAMRGVKSGGNKYCTIYTVNDDLPIFKNTKQAFSYWNDYWRN